MKNSSSTFARVAVTLCWLECVAISASAQPLPLAPMQVRADLLNSTGRLNTWKIGPLVLKLPSSWVDASTSSTASIKAPDETKAVFVALEATESARTGGYSALADPTRGPAAFLRTIQWDDCEGNPAKVAKSAPTPNGSKAMLVECNVESRPGLKAIYPQIAIYSPRYAVQIHAIGTRSEIDSPLDVLRSLKWSDET